MNTEKMTPDQIRAAGLEALVRELGPAGAIRFMQLFDRGTGDYSQSRHAWMDSLSRDEILAGIERLDADAPASSE